MNRRDELLRAAVFKAFDERDENCRVTTEAAQRVVDVWLLWPLIEYQHALSVAEAWRVARPRKIQQAIDAIRESYVTERAAAA